MACCSGDQERGEPRVEIRAPADDQQRSGPSGGSRTALRGGTFVMGTDGPMAYDGDGEAFVHEVIVGPFEIDTFAVTNDRFAAFIAATGYLTDAERFGWSFVFGGLLPDDFVETRGVAAAPWWRQVYGASWMRPEGPHSDLEGRDHEPVIHVSHDDALAFCRWDRSRLPTEAEWEYAARGGLSGADYPWGGELEPAGVHRMNVWQGSFPDSNTSADGFYGPAPVDTYEPNAFGLYNMCGNVWEWCADWFDADYYRSSERDDPQGPAAGETRVMRGGSYLCHASYCHRYRVGARSSSGPDSSAGNLGFRSVARHDLD